MLKTADIIQVPIYLNPKKDKGDTMEKVLKLLKDIKNLNNASADGVKLPNNVYYLNETDILCKERESGESRHPYDVDGLNLWIHSSGHVTANESNLIIFRSPYAGDAPSLDFWGGIKGKDGWIPISVTGATKPVSESEKVNRYTVYCPRDAYYIAETDKYIFSVRAHVASDKKIYFTAAAFNVSDEEAELYIAAYISPTLRFTNDDNEWAPYMRIGEIDENASCKITRFSNPEDNDITNISVIKTKVITDTEYEMKKTVSKTLFMGSGHSVFGAQALKSGEYGKEKNSVNTTDMAVYSSIVKFNMNPMEEFKMIYSLRTVHSDEEARKLLSENIDYKKIKEDIVNQEVNQQNKLSGFEITFENLKNDKVESGLFNRFLKSVRRQVSLCAFGKNYAANMLGMRDVYQQLNAALVWNSQDARKKMLLALNFIMDNGRVPRQISVPDVEGVIPKFDIRLYIDQGFWVVETFYKYLSFTGDISILDEECSYYEIIDEKKALYKKSETVDSALCHLIKITDFLVSNIDERTGCLKILYGDWNDAVCGLGKTEDDAPFGTGVSIMATLQLYKTLKEITEILELKGGNDEKCRKYIDVKQKLAVALESHSFQQDGDRTHILHGWGDKGSYNVGSLCDTDGKIRYSANPYSFWCISEMIERMPELKKSILRAYDVLDSKYGIKTFEPYFPRDMKGVGRITTLMPGTAENACAYVHATTFAIMALFILGEPERAWKQIYKIIPITHESVSKTPFVMPNSYCHNEIYNIDGESLGDWYTGSGAVLTRCIFEYAMGIRATVDGVKIITPSYVPADNVKMNFTVKNKNVSFVYENTHTEKRKYFINGVLQKTLIDSVSGSEYIMIDNACVTDNMEIKVVD